jgi:hypothetical protein
MTSVGSVSIDLRLNTAHFYQQLRSLEGRTLKPLALELKLDTTQFKRDLSALSRTSLKNIQVGAHLDATTLQRELRSLTQSKTALKVQAHLDSTQLQRELRQSLPSGQVNINTNFKGAAAEIDNLKSSILAAQAVAARGTGAESGARRQASLFAEALRYKQQLANIRGAGFNQADTRNASKLASELNRLNIRRIEQEFKQASIAAGGFKTSVGNALKDINQGIGQGIGQGLYNSVTGAITGSTAALAAFGKKSLDVAAEVQNFEIALSTITGSSQSAAREAESFRRVVDNLSLPLEASRRGFLQLSAAANGTALEGEGVRNIFDGVSHAVSGLNLPAGQADRAFVAISQVMGKGKVTAEEL